MSPLHIPLRPIALLLLGLTGWAHATDAETTAEADTELATIIVTANKREETARDVPMSLTTASGEQLLKAGIASPLDLPKIVPGLTVQPSPFNTPVYTMRGIGFYETSLSAAPTVA